MKELTDSKEVKDAILNGDTELSMEIGKKVLRVFISSTFTDTQAERNYMMREIYPEIREFCQEHGIDFNVIDLRWGIRDQATNDHMTTEICLSEIKKCFSDSINAPCFVFLSFNRYVALTATSVMK